ncbi:MAG: hypothetical protein ACYCT0_01070 [Sulfobacillus sp.]
MDETRRRIDLAQELVLAYRREMGEHVVAAACYGSVAHGRADAHSDLELIVLTDTAIEAVNVHMVRQGIQVECDVLPTERLRHAAQVVTIEWGVQADCYRYHWVIWDPTEQFAAVRETAMATPCERFEDALQQSWWSAREWAGKVVAAVETGNHPGAQFTAWQYLYLVALRVALAQQEPYGSLRTLWQEASARGFGIADMLGMLERGDIARLPEMIRSVQQDTGSWGEPVDPEEPFIRAK